MPKKPKQSLLLAEAEIYNLRKAIKQSVKLQRDSALIVDTFRTALCDLLAFYDKVTGEKSHGDGWTAADVKRLAEIRAAAAK